ncbi:MAG: polysaccharide deacetylase family protein [Crocinitomix sp.]|nr:polysaccharide deacetylase family protein [Crocinitomix sp.]
MRLYKFPKWLKRFYPGAIWDFSFSSPSKKIYLTFDDGPNPITTDWILETLAAYQAKATFFCIGKNVELHPDLYAKLLQNEHTVGNHSFSHVNGFKVKTKEYLEDIKKAQKVINSVLFRPPYGKITPKQHRLITQLGFKTVFWSHISYDFDKNLRAETRIKKLLDAVKPGAIVVFHDSDKAFAQLSVELPQILQTLGEKGYEFDNIKV